MFKYPETKYNLITRIDYLLNYKRLSFKLHNPDDLIAKSLISSIEDTKEYLGISTNEFFELAKQWSEKEEYIFRNKKIFNVFMKVGMENTQNIIFVQIY